ncbi:hypothetical protein AQJ43_31435 [Streptomyces avermitilis]|nr:MULTISPECIES: trypco2 family protein [Streptomyces]KUN50740.1 hypothetical protein AQJ43_31435 [Streptomyces avermitilis]MYS96289.1 hypothetical protein [Streptomyces sp. SID5469]BBJ48153.1 hypothetical protein SAVMC3_07820 [Streptomyces avermitilis]GDY69477.1 hypothetical protein SAV14893_088700 [Streptomyces avermitilis]GDY79730.1 hypothetical protein SAV31267_092150 [Streptomyces avermitilis]
MTENENERATELGDAIEAVRQGLLKAAAQGSDDLRFLVKETELEFIVELRKTGSTGAGVKAWVLSGDGRLERSAGQTNRLTVRLGILAPESHPIDETHFGDKKDKGHPGPRQM